MRSSARAGRSPTPGRRAPAGRARRVAASSLRDEPDLDDGRRVGRGRRCRRSTMSVWRCGSRRDPRVAQDPVGVELRSAAPPARGRGSRSTRTRSATGRWAAVRMASATIASLFASRPDLEDAHRRVERARVRRRGERRVGRDEDLGVAGARRERGREPQRVAEVADVGRRRDRRDRLLHVAQVRVVPFATTRAVRPAAMTLTLPPAGRSLSASTAAAFAASSRVGDTSVACIEAEVSMTSTMSPARPAGRSTNGRAARIARISDEQQLEEQQQAPAELLPRRVRLDVRDELLPQQRRRHDRLVAAQLEQVHRDDDRQEQQAGERERREEAHQPTTRRRRSSANTRSLSGDVGGDRHVRGAALGREVREAVLPGGEPRLVVVDRREVHRHVDAPRRSRCRRA